MDKLNYWPCKKMLLVLLLSLFFIGNGSAAELLRYPPSKIHVTSATPNYPSYVVGYIFNNDRNATSPTYYAVSHTTDTVYVEFRLEEPIPSPTLHAWMVFLVDNDRTTYGCGLLNIYGRETTAQGWTLLKEANCETFEMTPDPAYERIGVDSDVQVETTGPYQFFRIESIPNRDGYLNGVAYDDYYSDTFQIAEFELYYDAPSCSDGVLNQDETKIDCGGVCGECESETDTEVVSSKGPTSPGPVEWGGSGKVQGQAYFHLESL